MRQKPLNKFRGPYLDYDIPLNLAPGKRKERKLFSDLQRKNLRLRNRKALKRLELKENSFKKTKERYLRHLSFALSFPPNQEKQKRLKKERKGTTTNFSKKTVPTLFSLTENKGLVDKEKSVCFSKKEDFPILSFLSTKEKEKVGKARLSQKENEKVSRETVEREKEKGDSFSLKKKRVSFPSGVFKNIVERRLDSGKRTTPFKVSLLERKKVSFIYGNLAFKSLRRIAKSISGGRKGRQSFKRFHFNTQNLVNLLESRLDIVLFKIHFFSTLLAARQAIRNGMVTVNYKTVTFPGYQLRPADLINCNDKPENTQQIKQRAVSNLLSTAVERKKNTKRESEFSHFDMEKELFSFSGQRDKSKTQTSFVSLKNKEAYPHVPLFKKVNNIEETNQFCFFKTLHFCFLKKQVSFNKQIEKPQREISLLHTKRNPMKPLNVEVSYLSLSAIYLYPPQKVSFPAYIDLDTLFKSLS